VHIAVTALPRRRPVATLVSVAFAVSLAATVGLFADLLPGVRKTLPLFGTLVMVTGTLLVVTLLTWFASFILTPIDADAG